MMTPATNSRCGKTAARKGACAFAFAALISLTPALSQAKATGSVVVERITTTGTGTAREIVIATSKEATFSVFRLSDPFRILVDINDGKSGLSTEMTKVADGLVRYVATNQFADESSAILRVEIALDRPAEYHVRADGQQIRVTVGAEAPAPTPAKVETPAPEAATPAVEATPAIEPVAPAAASEPVRLGKLSRTLKGKKAVLVAPIVTGALTPQAVRLEQLENPRRLVVDLGTASAEPKFQKLNVGKLGVKTARLATHENGVRVVLDLDNKAEVPQVDVEEASGQLRLVISKAVVPTVAP